MLIPCCLSLQVQVDMTFDSKEIAQCNPEALAAFLKSAMPLMTAELTTASQSHAFDGAQWLLHAPVVCTFVRLCLLSLSLLSVRLSTKMITFLFLSLLLLFMIRCTTLAVFSSHTLHSHLFACFCRSLHPEYTPVWEAETDVLSLLHTLRHPTLAVQCCSDVTWNSAGNIIAVAYPTRHTLSHVGLCMRVCVLLLTHVIWMNCACIPHLCLAVLFTLFSYCANRHSFRFPNHALSFRLFLLPLLSLSASVLFSSV